MSTSKRSGSKKLYIVIDHDEGRVEEFRTLESAKEYITDVAREGSDADEIEEDFEVYEVVRKINIDVEEHYTFDINLK